MKPRVEHDMFGDFYVPEDAYWGVHTARARENFPITGYQIGDYPRLITALAWVKQAAARANHELGLLDSDRAAAIDAACQEIIEGQWHDQFIVDPIQGGAGTSTNMNANEVIANRALEMMGRPKGDYTYLNPNDHVNLSQSTNDAYPTALRMALIANSAELQRSLAHLEDVFLTKAESFDHVPKMGRTQLQDAVPMTLGQEFRAFAVTLHEDQLRLTESTLLLSEINLGATAIGTGLNAPVGYAAAVRRHLKEVSGIGVSTAANLVEATSDAGAFVSFSAVLKRIAVKMSKIASDLRLLSSGPRAGFNDINLPPVQAGSSIMPGKVNPVIPEVVNQIAFAVVGNDLTVTMACEAGQLQLNAFEPVIALSLANSLRYLTQGAEVLADKCVAGITANEEGLRDQVYHSIGLATALNPQLGYETASSVAKEALKRGCTVAEVVLDWGLLTEEELDEALQLQRLTGDTQ